MKSNASHCLCTDLLFLLSFTVRTDPEAHMVHVSTLSFLSFYTLYTSPFLSSPSLFCGGVHDKWLWGSALYTGAHLSRAWLHSRRCGGKLVVHQRRCAAYGQLNREQGRGNKQRCGGGWTHITSVYTLFNFHNRVYPPFKANINLLRTFMVQVILIYVRALLKQQQGGVVFQMWLWLFPRSSSSLVDK